MQFSITVIKENLQSPGISDQEKESADEFSLQVKINQLKPIIPLS